MRPERYAVHVRVRGPAGDGLVIAAFGRPRVLPVWWAARRRARQVARSMGARGRIERVRALPNRRRPAS